MLVRAEARKGGMNRAMRFRDVHTHRKNPGFTTLTKLLSLAYDIVDLGQNFANPGYKSMLIGGSSRSWPRAHELLKMVVVSRMG